MHNSRAIRNKPSAKPMKRYMLDTNICIYIMKRQPPEVAARFAECCYGEVVISSITLAELHAADSGAGQADNHVPCRPCWRIFRYSLLMPTARRTMLISGHVPPQAGCIRSSDCRSRDGGAMHSGTNNDKDFAYLPASAVENQAVSDLKMNKLVIN